MPFCNPDKIIIPEGRFRTATINDPEIKDMAESIKVCGQLQPILVTKSMELVDGLNRLLGCKRLNNREVWYEDEETAKLNLDNPLQRRGAELQANIRRRAFTPLQLAKGITEVDRMMREEYGERRSGPGLQEGWTQEETAEMLGFKSHRKVSEAQSIVKAAETGDMLALERAKTWQEAMRMVKGFSSGERPTIHTTHKRFLPIDKNTCLFHQGIRYELQLFDNENKFENFIWENSKLFFGGNNHYVDAKHTIKSKGFDVIPDGFLLDYSDKNKPILYIVEIELSSHSFRHISSHISTYTNLIINNWRNLIDIVLGYVPQEMHTSLHKYLSKTNCGMLIIFDKEDPKIELLFNAKPTALNIYKIISIESYKNVKSEDIIFAKTELLNPNTHSNEHKGCQLSEEDLAKFE